MKTTRLTWLALYLIHNRRITTTVAKRELQISQRTFWRYIGELRDAGMILAGNLDGGHGGGVDYIAFDPTLGPCR